MALQLGHEGLAEAHDLAVAATLGVEVAATLAAAHGQRGEAVLEDLLETEELQDGEVHTRVQAQTTLVGADGAVELHAKRTIDLDLASIVNPRHTEGDDALGLDDALEKACLLVFGMSLDDGLEGLQDLGHGLDELRLVGVLCLDLLDDALYVTHGFLLVYDGTRAL